MITRKYEFASQEGLRELVSAMAGCANEYLEAQNEDDKSIAMITLKAHALVLREDYNEPAVPSRDLLREREAARPLPRLTVRQFKLAFTAAGYISPTSFGIDDGAMKRIVKELNTAIAVDVPALLPVEANGLAHCSNQKCDYTFELPGTMPGIMWACPKCYGHDYHYYFQATPSTPPDPLLAELEKLVEKATPGEWVRSKHYFQIVGNDEGESVVETHQPKHRERDRYEANIELIVASVNHVKQLLRQRKSV